MNNLQYVFTRERRNFGRQCLFSDRNEVLFSEPSNRKFMQNYIPKNPVDMGTQLAKSMSRSEANTENIALASRGIEHVEGGWPRELNYKDEDQIRRYRKKSEREPNWASQVIKLTKPMLSATLQNGAVNITQNYFEDITPLDEQGKYSACVVKIFHDKILPARPIKSISLSSGTVVPQMVVCYSNQNFLHKDKNVDIFIWDLNDVNNPTTTLIPPQQATCIEWNMRDEQQIAAGLVSGLVAIWDPRSSNKPEKMTVKETSHHERISSLRWVHSKANTEFITGSPDGSVMTWDTRNLSQPNSQILLDPENIAVPLRKRAQGCSTLEFEYTIPARYMVGTEQGWLFVGNRKANAPHEKILLRFPVMDGPIYAIERNPFYMKNMLMIGDWCAKIWNEDCKEVPIWRTYNHSSPLRCGTWSPTRCSLFFIGRSDSYIEFWDLLIQQDSPIFLMKLDGTPLLSMKCSENGRNLVVGTKGGDIYVIEMEETLVHNLKNDKSTIAMMFDRESNRGKVLEGRMREIKFKLEGTKKPEEDDESQHGEEEEAAKDEEELDYNEVKKIFDQLVQDEIKKRKQKKFEPVITPFDT